MSCANVPHTVGNERQLLKAEKIHGFLNFEAVINLREHEEFRTRISSRYKFAKRVVALAAFGCIQLDALVPFRRQLRWHQLAHPETA